MLISVGERVCAMMVDPTFTRGGGWSLCLMRQLQTQGVGWIMPDRGPIWRKIGALAEYWPGIRDTQNAMPSVGCCLGSLAASPSRVTGFSWAASTLADSEKESAGAETNTGTHQHRNSLSGTVCGGAGREREAQRTARYLIPYTC